MGYKLDFTIIIRDHIKTIKNDTKKKPDFRDYFFFLVIPIAIASYLVFKEVFLNDSYINSIISGLSIYVGLSLNLMVLLFDIIQKGSATKFKKDFAKELIANISFSIILSIFTIVFSLLTQLEFNCILKEYKIASNWIAYFLLMEMLLTIIQLIRNMYYQMLNEIK